MKQLLCGLLLSQEVVEKHGHEEGRLILALDRGWNSESAWLERYDAGLRTRHKEDGVAFCCRMLVHACCCCCCGRVPAETQEAGLHRRGPWGWSLTTCIDRRIDSKRRQVGGRAVTSHNKAEERVGLAALSWEVLGLVKWLWRMSRQTGRGCLLCGTC